MKSADFHELLEVIPPDRLILNDIDPIYETDALGHLRSRPGAVVLAQNAKEIRQVLAWANQYRIPVTPRGAGTNLTGSTVPIKDGLVLDISGMKKILQLDEKTMSVVCEPGVLLKDLQVYAEQRGYFYPPDPGEKTASIGGNISTNAGGMRAVKYGVTRDYVRSLDVVLADGTLCTFGSKNIKDASGLDLKDILIGSEGTLGVITRCTLKIIPKPDCARSILAGFRNLEEGIACVNVLLKSSLQPTAVEFVNRKATIIGEEYLNYSWPFPQAGSYLLLKFDGTEAAVNKEIYEVQELLLENKALGVHILKDPDEEEQIWKVRGILCTAIESKSQQEPMDIVVPVDKITEFVSYCEELECASKADLISFGHAGDGNVHLCIMRGERTQEEWDRDLGYVLEKLYEKCSELGGLPSGEHGIGIQKQVYFHRYADPVCLDLMQKIKSVFDPNGILNPGRSYLKPAVSRGEDDNARNFQADRNVYRFTDPGHDQAVPEI